MSAAKRDPSKPFLVPSWAQSVVPGHEANAGLVFAKYAGKSIEKDDRDRSRSKVEFDQAFFHERIAALECGAANPRNARSTEVWLTGVDSPRLTRAIDRQKRLLEALGAEPLPFVTLSPLAVGLGLDSPIENGLEFHPTLGVPYLPGSAVKGTVRAWVDAWSGDELGETDAEVQALIERVFGRPGDEEGTAAGAGAAGIGTVLFFDALPWPPARIERDVMTPHASSYYQEGAAPGDWLNPTPLEFYVVPPATIFWFGLAPACRVDPRHASEAQRARARGSAEDAQTAITWLARALDEIGAGAKTAAGYGRFARL